MILDNSNYNQKKKVLVPTVSKALFIQYLTNKK